MSSDADLTGSTRPLDAREDAKHVVAEGYDAIAERFAAWTARIEGDPRNRWLAELEDFVPAGSRVLEIGSGGGGASTQRLAERYSLMGVDISQEQIRRAQVAVPDAEFVHADASRLELPAGSFDAVVALYVFNHVPRAEQLPLLRKVERWLRPGGYLLATFGVGDSEDVVERNWLGAPMFFASFDSATNRKNLSRAGFTIVRDEVATIVEPDGEARFQRVIARRGSPGRGR